MKVHIFPKNWCKIWNNALHYVQDTCKSMKKISTKKPKKEKCKALQTSVSNMQRAIFELLRLIFYHGLFKKGLNYYCWWMKHTLKHFEISRLSLYVSKLSRQVSFLKEIEAGFPLAQ